MSWPLVSRETVRVLERELAWMRQQFLHERQRAEQAVDQLLALKQVQPVSYPLVHDPLPPRPAAGPTAEEIWRDPEFAAAGT